MSNKQPDIRSVQEAVQELVELHDERPVYLSIICGNDWNDSFFTKRARQVSKVLGKEDAGVLSKNMELALPVLEKKKEPFAVFISTPSGLFTVVDLPRKWKEDRLVVDTSPYIRDLAEVQDDWETYLLVVSGETSASIEVVELGKGKEIEHSSKDIMHRHKNGGMSQRRYQRLRAGAVDHYLKEVAEDVTDAFETTKVARIILAGPGTGKKKLYDRLPKHVQAAVIAQLDVDDERGDPVASSLVAYLKDELKQEEELVAEFRSAVMQGGGVYGSSDLAAAVYEGRARLLLVLHGATRKGWRCEHCGLIGDGTEEKCPLCSESIAQVDLVEEVLEEAVKKETAVEFVHDSPFLKEIGGMGAFLRY